MTPAGSRWRARCDSSTTTTTFRRRVAGVDACASVRVSNGGPASASSFQDVAAWLDSLQSLKDYTYPFLTNSSQDPADPGEVTWEATADLSSSALSGRYGTAPTDPDDGSAQSNPAPSSGTNATPPPSSAPSAAPSGSTAPSGSAAPSPSTKGGN